MPHGNTTAVIQSHLEQLMQADVDSDFPASLNALIEQSVNRLLRLCTITLHRKYPRLARPPLNLQAEELLSQIVERLLKALKDVRPTNVRQFFGIANQHIRWQLNEFVRSIENRGHSQEFKEERYPIFDLTDSQLSDDCKQILRAIEELPADQQEVFDLVRIHGLSVTECAEILHVSEMTVRRRLNRAISKLAVTVKISTNSNDD